MEVEELALRPKSCPAVLEDEAGKCMSAGPTNATSSLSSPSRKRKASSMERDGDFASATGQDTIGTKVEVPPPTFGADDEVKLVLNHLQDYTSPETNVENRPVAEKTADEPVKLGRTEYRTTQRSPAQALTLPEPTTAVVSILPGVAVATELILPINSAAPHEVRAEHVEVQDRIWRAQIDESDRVVGESKDALAMCTTTGQAEAIAQHGTAPGLPESLALFHTSVPRKLRRLYERPARPIGSYASFTQQATRRNRVAARWKGQPSPFFSQK
jgi:hypothetical protein